MPPGGERGGPPFLPKFFPPEKYREFYRFLAQSPESTAEIASWIKPLGAKFPVQENKGFVEAYQGVKSAYQGNFPAGSGNGTFGSRLTMRAKGPARGGAPLRRSRRRRAMSRSVAILLSRGRLCQVGPKALRATGFATAAGQGKEPAPGARFQGPGPPGGPIRPSLLPGYGPIDPPPIAHAINTASGTGIGGQVTAEPLSRHREQRRHIIWSRGCSREVGVLSHQGRVPDGTRRTPSPGTQAAAWTRSCGCEPISCTILCAW
jgi:hypothetical protein